jgi:hypothetical protein
MVSAIGNQNTLENQDDVAEYLGLQGLKRGSNPPD